MNTPPDGLNRGVFYRRLLAAHCDDPDLYWQVLLTLLTVNLEALQHTHHDCGDPQCRLCLLISDSTTLLDAHDSLQPSGCGCAGHISIPAPVELAEVAAR
jgi:hypothetical protein